MNKNYLLTLTLILYGILAFAQIGVYNGKPTYNIEARRNGTSIGNIVVELFPTIAPKHVRNFDSLVSINFYDTTAFHRVVPGFVIQGGDPNSRHGPRETWGYGDPNQQNVPAEFNPVSHLRGVLSAARDNDINSANSQFFICVAPATFLNQNYTAYGRVVSGINIVDTIVSAPSDANDNPFNKIEMFVTRAADNAAATTAPSLTSPLNNAEGITPNYKFEWSAVPGAEIYEVEVSKNANFDIINILKRTATNNTTIGDLELGKTNYYWRVKSNNGGFISDASESRMFTTSLPAPALVSPPTNTTLEGISTPVTWRSIEGADSYRVQVATSAVFSNNKIIFDVSGITDTTIQVIGLAPNVRYYWHVATETNLVAGEYSAPFNFRTGTTTGIVQQRFIKSCYPNPTSGEVYFTFYEKRANTVFTLYDMLGKQVYTEAFTQQDTNDYTHRIDLSNIANGIYYYHFDSGHGDRDYGKLTITR